MVEYFTKWENAATVASITQRRVEKFVWKNIVCRYEIPNALIMDNDPQQKGDHMRDFCDGLHIRMKPSSMAHLQTNNQTETINGLILTTMKVRLNEVKGAWPDELLGTLWSMRTTPNSGTKDMSFFLEFGHEAVIPTEIGTKTLRVTKYSDEANKQELREDFNRI